MKPGKPEKKHLVIKQFNTFRLFFNLEPFIKCSNLETIFQSFEFFSVIFAIASLCAKLLQTNAAIQNFF